MSILAALERAFAVLASGEGSDKPILSENAHKQWADSVKERIDYSEPVVRTEAGCTVIECDMLMIRRAA